MVNQNNLKQQQFIKIPLRMATPNAGGFFSAAWFPLNIIVLAGIAGIGYLVYRLIKLALKPKSSGPTPPPAKGTCPPGLRCGLSDNCCKEPDLCCGLGGEAKCNITDPANTCCVFDGTGTGASQSGKYPDPNAVGNPDICPGSQCSWSNNVSQKPTGFGGEKNKNTCCLGTTNPVPCDPRPPPTGIGTLCPDSGCTNCAKYTCNQHTHFCNTTSVEGGQTDMPPNTACTTDADCKMSPAYNSEGMVSCCLQTDIYNTDENNPIGTCCEAPDPSNPLSSLIPKRIICDKNGDNQSCCDLSYINPRNPSMDKLTGGCCGKECCGRGACCTSNGSCSFVGCSNTIAPTENNEVPSCDTMPTCAPGSFCVQEYDDATSKKTATSCFSKPPCVADAPPQFEPRMLNMGASKEGPSQAQVPGGLNNHKNNAILPLYNCALSNSGKSQPRFNKDGLGTTMPGSIPPPTGIGCPLISAGEQGTNINRIPLYATGLVNPSESAVINKVTGSGTSASNYMGYAYSDISMGRTAGLECPTVNQSGVMPYNYCTCSKEDCFTAISFGGEGDNLYNNQLKGVANAPACLDNAGVDPNASPPHHGINGCCKYGVEYACAISGKSCTLANAGTTCPDSGQCNPTNICKNTEAPSKNNPDINLLCIQQNFAESQANPGGDPPCNITDSCQVYNQPWNAPQPANDTKTTLDYTKGNLTATDMPAVFVKPGLMSTKENYTKDNTPNNNIKGKPIPTSNDQLYYMSACTRYNTSQPYGSPTVPLGKPGGYSVTGKEPLSGLVCAGDRHFGAAYSNSDTGWTTYKKAHDQLLGSSDADAYFCGTLANPKGDQTRDQPGCYLGYRCIPGAQQAGMVQEWPITWEDMLDGSGTSTERPNAVHPYSGGDGTSTAIPWEVNYFPVKYYTDQGSTDPPRSAYNDAIRHCQNRCVMNDNPVPKVTGSPTTIHDNPCKGCYTKHNCLNQSLILINKQNPQGKDLTCKWEGGNTDGQCMIPVQYLTFAQACKYFIPLMTWNNWQKLSNCGVGYPKMSWVTGVAVGGQDDANGMCGMWHYPGKQAQCGNFEGATIRLFGSQGTDGNNGAVISTAWAPSSNNSPINPGAPWINQFIWAPPGQSVKATVTVNGPGTPTMELDWLAGGCPASPATDPAMFAVASNSSGGTGMPDRYFVTAGANYSNAKWKSFDLQNGMPNESLMQAFSGDCVTNDWITTGAGSKLGLPPDGLKEFLWEDGKKPGATLISQGDPGYGAQCSGTTKTGATNPCQGYLQFARAVIVCGCKSATGFQLGDGAYPCGNNGCCSMWCDDQSDDTDGNFRNYITGYLTVNALTAADIPKTPQPSSGPYSPSLCP